MANVKVHQAGFGAVGIVAIVLAVGVLAGIGYVVFNNSDKKAATAVTTAPETKPRADETGAAKAEPGKPEPYVLEVKEWGISFPLTDELNDAYYTTVGGGVGADGLANTVWISLKSLDGTSCDIAKTGPTETSNPVGFIGRVLPDELEPVKGVPYKDLYPDGVVIEKHYYFYVASVKADCKSKQELESVNTSFKNAAKGAGKTAAAKQ